MGQNFVTNVPGIRGTNSKLNITTATVVKATPGTIVRAVVTTAGSAAGTINDCATTGAAAAANLVATIPNTVGAINLEFPMLTGIVIVPGTGQVVSVSFS